MTPPSGHSEYARRMHQVLEHIDRHLDQPLELTELAGVAHFSAFHFHRVFAAWMGETLGDYLRRRRLELAAVRLVAQPGVPVLSVALSVGFGSGEAFARAFKTRFGSSPSAWRKREAVLSAQRRQLLSRDRDDEDSNPDQAMGNAGQAPAETADHHEASSLTTMEEAMRVTVIERQPVKVAYLRHVGPYGKPLSMFWQDAVYPWMITNNLLGRPRYGVSHDDPAITAASQCRYDAAVEISEPLMAAGSALITSIPGGRYAITPYRGTAEAIAGAWHRFLRDWLPASGLQLDARPFFEYYPEGSSYDASSGVFTCELALPVAPL